MKTSPRLRPPVPCLATRRLFAQKRLSSTKNHNTFWGLSPEILGRFRSFWPYLAVGFLIAAGCAMTRTVYVKEQDRATVLKPGQVYTNLSDTVEWVVPRAVMTQLVIANEGL